MMSKTWLVTGSARGLGRHIAEAVLAAGDNLVATARDPSRLSNYKIVTTIISGSLRSM